MSLSKTRIYKESMAYVGQCGEKGFLLLILFSVRLQRLLYQQSCGTLMPEKLQEWILLLGAAVEAKELVVSPGWNRQWSVHAAHYC